MSSSNTKGVRHTDLMHRRNDLDLADNGLGADRTYQRDNGLWAAGTCNCIA